MKSASYIVSCMYGTANPFKLELMEKKSGDEKYNVIDTYAYDSKKAGMLMTDEQYYEKLKSFVGDRKIKGVRMKNNAASFVECIRRHGEYSVSEFVEVAQDTLVTMGWVSVDDRLPEEDGHYITTDGNVVDVHRYWKDGWCFGCLLFCQQEEATHWMPLPEPPKEGK